MRYIFERLLKHCADVYSDRIGRNGMPYVLHPLEVMSAVVPLPERIVALAHDYGEFRPVDELAELGIPSMLLDKIRLLTKSFPDDVPENDERCCEYIWNLLADPVCRKIKYHDLRTNDGFEESPSRDGRRRTSRCSRVLNLLKDAVEDGKLFFFSKSLYFNIFSNFHMDPLTIDGTVWQSGEHYYQAAKFAEESPWANPEMFKAVQTTPGPATAKFIAQFGLHPEIPLPDEYRIRSMKKMLRIKFASGTLMHRRLLQTGNLDLIHETRSDFFWGQSRSGKGQNHLGKLLMQIRQGSSGDQ